MFAHRKQLDFGSVLGPDGQIMLSDTTLIQVLHAHVRVQTITDFSLQPSFTAFTALREYMRTHWIPMEYDDPERKTRGFLCNLIGTLPTPILVVPHLNRAVSYFMKYGKIMMMTMGYSLLIIPIVVPFFLLTMPQGTGQHNPCQEMRMMCPKGPGPLLQWMMLTLIRITSLVLWLYLFHHV